jgi:hypothetical protein
MPSISAASRSAATARICLPSFVRSTSRRSPIISDTLSTITMIRTMSMFSTPMWMPVENEMKFDVL